MVFETLARWFGLEILLALAVFETVVHCAVLVRLKDTPPDQPRWPWALALGFMAGLYATMAWSYAGMLRGVRDFEAHILLVQAIGGPLLAYPGLLLVGIIKQGDAQAQKVVDEIASARRSDAELLRAVTEAQVVTKPGAAFDDALFDDRLSEFEDLDEDLEEQA